MYDVCGVHRDTELAIGAYQDDHRVKPDGTLPQGDVCRLKEHVFI